MSDEHVRAAEAEWRRLGSVHAGARWLVERVRTGLNRSLHLEWLAFLGDAPSAAALELLEPRGLGRKKRSARVRRDARESSLDPSERAESAESDLFWYSLVREDREAAMRALLAAVERARAPADGVAALADVILRPSRDAAMGCVTHVGRTGALTHACEFAAASYAERPVEDWSPPPEELFYDAMSHAGHEGGGTEVIRAVLTALRGWWIEADDIARRLAHGAPMKIYEIAGAEGLGLLRSILGPLRLEPDTHEALLATFRRELAEPGDKRIILVGEVEGEPVATVQLILKDADGDPELADGRTIAHVHHLRVRQDQQGKGLAREIMADVESRAKNLGFQTLTLGVDDTNRVARGLYGSLGYDVFKTEAGRSPEETLLLMRKST